MRPMLYEHSSILHDPVGRIGGHGVDLDQDLPFARFDHGSWSHAELFTFAIKPDRNVRGGHTAAGRRNVNLELELICLYITL